MYNIFVGNISETKRNWTITRGHSRFNDYWTMHVIFAWYIIIFAKKSELCQYVEKFKIVYIRVIL